MGLFALYLSYTHAGQEFMTFQLRVSLLLESGFWRSFFLVVRGVSWFGWLPLVGLSTLCSWPAPRSWSPAIRHGVTSPRSSTTSRRSPYRRRLGGTRHTYRALVLEGATAAALIVEVGLVFLIFAPRRLRHDGSVVRDRSSAG